MDKRFLISIILVLGILIGAQQLYFSHIFERICWLPQDQYAKTIHVVSLGSSGNSGNQINLVATTSFANIYYCARFGAILQVPSNFPAPVPSLYTKPVETNNLDYYQNTTTVEPCSFFQCLFKASGQIIGYAQLDGYYRSETVIGGGEEDAYSGQTQTCDRFIVTGGSQPLINQFLDRIKSGNTLNKITNGSLVINLDLADPNLDTSLVEHIRASTSQAPISLGVLQTYIEGKGAGPCTSTIRVVNENRALNTK